MTFYAVANGRNSGIYSSWNDCKEQLHKFSASVFKKFQSHYEAENFIRQNSYSTSGVINNTYYKTYSYGSSRSSLKRSWSVVTSTNNQQADNTKRKKYNEIDDYSGSENKDKFIFDKYGFIEVYTDGACIFNGKNNARAGVGVWFNDNNSFNVSQPIYGRATNHKAEIAAVTVAAKQAQKAGIEKLKINTDSKFVISCDTEWMPKWKKNGWQTAHGTDVVNKAELIEMDKALEPLIIKWNHVKSHAGVHGNEMADQLARDASQSYKKKKIK